MSYKKLTKLEDKIWDDFCSQTQNTKVKKPLVKKRFQSHPKQIDSDTSDASLEEIHWNRNFNRVDSLQEFDNMGIIELNNNELLNDLNDMEKSKGIEEKQEVKCVARLARVVSSKKDLKSNSNEKLTRNIEKNSQIGNKIIMKTKLPERQAIDDKLKALVEKILCSIDEIRLAMESNEILPDGEEDLIRRKKRAKEFSGRFSRMYLYQIGRHLSDLQRIAKMSSSSVRLSYRAHNFDYQQKLLTIHQLIMQGFQAYQNHLPTSVPQGIPDKLKELLNNSISVCDIHRNLINCDINLVAKRSQIIDIFENHCQTLLEKMKENVQSNVSLMSLNSKPSTTDNKKNTQKKRKLQSRLSMYNQGMSLNASERFWKRTVSNLAKKKFNVQSRYKTATLKHRPPPMKVLDDDKSKPITLSQGQSEGTVRSSKSKPCNTDDIQTMVQMETEVANDDGNGDIENDDAGGTREMFDIRNDILKPLTRSIFEQFCDENKDMTQNEFEILLQKLLILVRNNDQNNIDKNLNEDRDKIKLDDDDFVQNVMKVMQQETNEELLHGQNVTEKRDKRKKETIKKKKKQTITITGAKNAQLICIRDDSSIIEDIESNNVENVKTGNIKNKQEASVCVCETQTDDVSNLIDSSIKLNDEITSRTNVKISRLPKKALNNLNLLPKDMALNVIQYKLDFSKINKKNHMYKKTDKIQPWLLTGEIADNILHQVLLSVIREIEINEILENLYKSEFL